MKLENDIFDAHVAVRQSKLQEILEKLAISQKTTKSQKTEKDALKNLKGLSFSLTTELVQINEKLNHDEGEPTEKDRQLFALRFWKMVMTTASFNCSRHNS